MQMVNQIGGCLQSHFLKRTKQVEHCEAPSREAFSANGSQRLDEWIPGFLTRLPSSWSSSLMELDGEGVADLLAGGDGDVWVMLFGPETFTPSCALRWDWLMVVRWPRGIIPLGLLMLMRDLIIMAGLEGYWRRWLGPTFCR